MVSSHDGGPAYGGTPSDAAVLAAIADLKARGLRVTLYPMLLMDIPADNAHGPAGLSVARADQLRAGAGNGWDGGWHGDAAAQVAAFVGGVDQLGLSAVCAALCGAWPRRRGRDALIIGSEMRGLTSVRGAGGSFPFVSALVDLAAEAQALAPGVKLTYAADWSRVSRLFSPKMRRGTSSFTLDPLWASSDIAAVGIDNYMPVADWRDGEDQPDAATWDGPHELDYLAAKIAGGEGFDWYYASDADRLAGERTPITDGAYGEPWVWRFKDIAGWWANAHHDRLGGVRAGGADGLGAGEEADLVHRARLRGGRQGGEPAQRVPRPQERRGRAAVFLDRRAGCADAAAGAAGASATLGERREPGVGGLWRADGGPARISLWTWDARPYPAFPALTDTWSDAANHATGHWLTGRLGGLASDELIAAVAADFGVEVAAAEAALPLVHGLAVEAVASARDALSPLLGATGLGVRDGVEGLELAAATARAAVAIAADDLVATDAAAALATAAGPVRGGGAAGAGLCRPLSDYLRGSVTAMRPEGGAVAGENTALVLDAAGARAAAERSLIAASAQRDTLELTLPPSFAALEVGDVIDVAGEADGPFEIAEIRDGLARRISARAMPPANPAVVLGDGPQRASATVVPGAVPLVVLAHLPPDPATPGQSRLAARGLGVALAGERRSATGVDRRAAGAAHARRPRWGNW